MEGGGENMNESINKSTWHSDYDKGLCSVCCERRAMYVRKNNWNQIWISVYTKWNVTQLGSAALHHHGPRDHMNTYTGYTQNNGAVSKVNKKFISHLTLAQPTLSAAATVHVSHALPAVRFSCLLRGRGASFQDGVAAGKGFLCAPFWGVQICDYSAAWVSCTV